MKCGFLNTKYGQHVHSNVHPSTTTSFKTINNFSELKQSETEPEPEQEQEQEQEQELKKQESHHVKDNNPNESESSQELEPYKLDNTELKE